MGAVLAAHLHLRLAQRGRAHPTVPRHNLEPSPLALARALQPGPVVGGHGSGRLGRKHGRAGGVAAKAEGGRHVPRGVVAAAQLLVQRRLDVR